MNLWPSESPPTWDTSSAAFSQPLLRDKGALYEVRPRSALDYARLVPILLRNVTSADFDFAFEEIGDPLWDASLAAAVWRYKSLSQPSTASRGQQSEARGPLGGRLISLADALELADKSARDAFQRRLEAREREATYWADLEEET